MEILNGRKEEKGKKGGVEEDYIHLNLGVRGNRFFSQASDPLPSLSVSLSLSLEELSE